MLTFFRKIYPEEEQKAKSLFFLGPLFLFLSLSLVLYNQNYNLVLLTFISLLALWKMRMKGFLFSAFILFTFSLWNHLFQETAHLWQLGLESTVAMGLGITALSFEEILHSVESIQDKVRGAKKEKESLHLTLTTKNETFEAEKKALVEEKNFLALELTKEKNEREKLKDFCEALQFNQIKVEESKEELLSDLSHKIKQMASLKYDLEETKSQLTKLKDHEALNQENQNLLKQLNSARVQKYQTHLINETMAKLLSKESKKLKLKEVEVEGLKKELKEMQPHDTAQNAVTTKEMIDLHHKIDAMQKELNLKVEALNIAEKKLSQIKEIEPKYFQLRHQFDEKKNELHRLRQELFKLETENLNLKSKSENQKMKWDPQIDQLMSEMGEVDAQMALIESENQDLIDIISTLSVDTQ